MILLALLTVCIFAFYGFKTIEYNKNPWVEDLTYLGKTLPDLDPFLYYKIDKEKFISQLDDLKGNAGKMGDDEIEVKLSLIISQIGDAHTRVAFVEDSKNRFPLFVSCFKDCLYVVCTDEKYSNLLGCQLIKINGLPIEKIIADVNTLISHENEYWLKDNNPDYLMDSRVLKYFKIIDTNQASFTFMTQENKLLEINLSAQDPRAFRYVYIINSAPNKPLRIKNSAYYWYEYIAEDKILYFQYNSCHPKEELKQMNPNDRSIDNLPEFDELTTEMLKLVDENKVDKFVMDLRYNTGGHADMGTLFISHLADSMKGKNIKIYGLIGNHTFSAGVWNALDLKNKTSAILIGQPTGGTPNGYGDGGDIILPNTKLKLYYTTRPFNLSSVYKNTVTPDYFIETSFEEHKNGIDPVFGAVKNH